MASYTPRQRAHTARRRRSRGSGGGKQLKWFLICAAVLLITVGAVFFAVRMFGKTENNLQKLSYPRKYSEYVTKAAKDYDLPEALIYAVIRTESSFNPDAESGVGARGLMQVMPESFDWLMETRGTTGEYTADDLFEPEVCIDYGSYLLRFFYDYYGTEQCAVAAYNAGFVVDDWLKNPDYSADGVTLDNIPYPETSSYVEKVEEAKEMYIKLYY